jgi:hypothetical protein
VVGDDGRSSGTGARSRGFTRVGVQLSQARQARDITDSANPPAAPSAGPERSSEVQEATGGPPVARRYVPRGSQEYQAIGAYMQEFSQELGDRASVKSSTTRAYHVFERSGLDLSTFLGALVEARSITKERSQAIRGAGSAPPGQAYRPKAKVAYLFAVLEDLAGLREDVQAQTAPEAENGPKSALHTPRGTNSLPQAETGLKSQSGAKFGHSPRGSRSAVSAAEDGVAERAESPDHAGNMVNWHQVGDLVYNPHTRRFVRKPSAPADSPSAEHRP